MRREDQVTDVGLPLLTAKEIQRRLKVGRTTLWRKIRQGKFPPPLVDCGGRRRWTESDWQAYLKRLKSERPAWRRPEK